MESPDSFYDIAARDDFAKGSTMAEAAAILNQTSGDSYTCSIVPELSSVRYAHGNRRAVGQTCAQRTLRPLCTNVIWFDLESTASFLKLGAKKLWLDYDEEADVLYVSFRKPQKATDSRMEGGLIYHYRDEELVGVTILHASEIGHQSEGENPR